MHVTYPLGSSGLTDWLVLELINPDCPLAEYTTIVRPETPLPTKGPCACPSSLPSFELALDDH
jgi:hypothetical protein